jgi:hypothetical protein
MISYKCHSCGSTHEIESIRENLYYGRSPVGTLPAFQPSSAPSLGGYLARREVIRILSRGLQGRPVPPLPRALP